MDTKLPASFWTQPAFEDFDHEMLLAVVWMRTNDRLNLLGYADFGRRAFEFQTRLSFEALERAFDALGVGIVRDGNRYWIREYVAEQFGRGESLVNNHISKPIVRAFASVDSPSIALAICEEYPELFGEDFVARAEGLTKPQNRTEQIREDQSRAEKGIGGAGGKGKPKLEDVRAYAAEIGLTTLEADKFFDHYESSDWKRKGGVKIKEWRAALRNWQRNGDRFAGVGKNSHEGAAVPVFDPSKPFAHTGGVPVAN